VNIALPPPPATGAYDRDNEAQTRRELERVIRSLPTAFASGGLQWKGPWSSATTYAVNDVVSYLGVMYVAILAHLNQAPPSTAYWTFVQSALPMIDPCDPTYGATGDGTADDTTELQAALTAGAALGKVVYGGAHAFKISSALTMSGPGLVFDTVPHGSGATVGIKITGTGYTALTVSGSPQHMHLTLFGTGQTANGVLFQNPQLAVVQHVRVFDLDGFGVKINKCWDCLFGSISVEECGNASQYAFSMNDDGDTCNMTHILRLQVELANLQAIEISPNTLSCVVDNIHSEQATVSASYTTWRLGGGGCHFNSGRFHASGTTTNALFVLEGAHSVYTNLRVEDSIPVRLEAFSGTELTVISPTWTGAVSIRTNTIGHISILGGLITTLATAFIRDTVGPPAGPLRIMTAVGVRITTLTIGDCMNPPNADLAMFVGCHIGTLGSSSTLSAATFLDCSILSAGNLLQGFTLIRGGFVTVGTMQAQGPLRAFGTKFIGNVTYTGYELFDPGCSATGTVTGATAPTQGTWLAGELTKLLSTAALWRCSVAGTPGTWVAGGGASAGTLTLSTGLSGGSYDGSANVTATVTGAPASGITGTTLAATVVSSSLTSVGTLGSVVVSGQGTFQRATDGGADSVQLGGQNSVTGGLRIWNSVASGEGQVYGDATYGLRFDTNGNARPIGIDGSEVVITSPVKVPAGTTSRASLRAPHGSAPTSPVDGDIWTTTAGLFVRINGVTVGPLS